MKLLSNILKSHLFGYGHKQRLQVVAITLACVLTALFLGRLIDRLLGQEKSVFTLIFVILSFPITQGMIYLAFRKQGEKK